MWGSVNRPSGRADSLSVLLDQQERISKRAGSTVAQREIDPKLAEICHRVAAFSDECRRELKGLRNKHFA